MLKFFPRLLLFCFRQVATTIEIRLQGDETTFIEFGKVCSDLQDGIVTSENSRRGETERVRHFLCWFDWWMVRVR